MLLPLNKDDSIDYSALETEVDILIESGLHGIYTNGTAGEFHTQTEEEFDRISTLAAEKCNRAGMPFQLGVSHMSAQLSRERLRRAKALEPSAFQVILPDWVPVSSSEAVVFLREMAEIADPVGIVLYTPPHAKRPLDADAIAALHASVPELVGVKLADGNSSWYANIRRKLSRLSVFVPGHHLATGRLLGASGSYSNIACLSPTGAKWWDDLMNTDPAAAIEFEKRLLVFFGEHLAPMIAQGIFGAAVDKAMSAAGGWSPISPRMRWPYKSVSEEQVAKIADAARRALPEFWLTNAIAS